MSERVRSVFWLAILVDHPDCGLQGVEVVEHAAVAYDVSLIIREHQICWAAGAGQSPFPQHVEDHWRHRDFTLPSYRLWPTKLVPLVGALANTDYSTIKVYGNPGQSAQFTVAHSGKDGRHK